MTEKESRRLFHPGKVTDAAWGLAEEYGLCPSLIEGTWHKGKVLKGDVEAAVDELNAKLMVDSR